MIDELPIFTPQDLRKDSHYPQAGEALCEVLGTVPDVNRRGRIRIRTLEVETTTGETEFVVDENQVSFATDYLQ